MNKSLLSKFLFIFVSWLYGSHAITSFAQNEIMSMTTQKQVGETIQLVIDAPIENRNDIRIDLGNGKKELITTYGFPITYTLANNTIKIYGKVTALYCQYNNLTILDVTQNESLQQLWCQNNQLTTLNLTNNIILETLDCSGNLLPELNLDTNTALHTLFGSNNNFTTLEVTQSHLTDLFCHNNKLEQLSLENTESLHTLWIFGNQMQPNNLSNLLASLPQAHTQKGDIHLVDKKDTYEVNRAFKSDVTTLAGKGWQIYDWNNGEPVAYIGETDISTDISNPLQDAVDMEAPVYNLFGTQVGTRSTLSTLKPGIYVSKNKKIIIE